MICLGESRFQEALVRAGQLHPRVLRRRNSLRYDSPSGWVSIDIWQVSLHPKRRNMSNKHTVDGRQLLPPCVSRCSGCNFSSNPWPGSAAESTARIPNHRPRAWPGQDISRGFDKGAAEPKWIMTSATSLLLLHVYFSHDISSLSLVALASLVVLNGLNPKWFVPPPQQPVLPSAFDVPGLFRSKTTAYMLQKLPHFHSNFRLPAQTMKAANNTYDKVTCVSSMGYFEWLFASCLKTEFKHYQHKKR